MVCRIVLGTFGLAYMLALFIYLTGTYGWFGQPTGALSGIYLVPLGLPWNLIDASEAMLPVLGLGAPLINIALIWLLCRVLGSKAGR